MLPQLQGETPHVLAEGAGATKGRQPGVPPPSTLSLWSTARGLSAVGQELGEGRLRTLQGRGLVTWHKAALQTSYLGCVHSGIHGNWRIRGSSVEGFIQK